MPGELSLLVAQTHPPEYRLHKYWSRKPHNVLSHFIGALLKRPGVVVDPFTGSGVAAREAALLGHEVHAFDVNPAAIALSKVTTAPPDRDAFLRLVKPLIDDFEVACERAYRCAASGETIRYAVHAVVVACPDCDGEYTADQTTGSGRSRRCPNCAKHLRFNLEYLLRTEITAYSTQKHHALIREPERLAAQERASNHPDREAPEGFALPFDENRRILSFRGMDTADLFTPRNHALLSQLAQQFHALEPAPVRRAALLLLTASVAQCSRLIAFRNQLSSGGPAWSVPGFWVPPLHLETNPHVHIHARLRRFVAGLEALHQQPTRGSVYVRRCHARDGLRALRDQNKKADLVFFDPPYGDSVPFVEFSTLWNAFLRAPAMASDDIAVSNRNEASEAWSHYREQLRVVLEGVASVMADDGAILVTFNNHDLRAWQALLDAMQNAAFYCTDVSYQIPAVISSKAAFSPEGSYVGDLYAIYRRPPAHWRASTDLQPVRDALRRCASARHGKLSRKLALRTVAVAWLQHNLDPALLGEREALLDSCFNQDGPLLTWKGPLDAEVPRLDKLLPDIAGHLTEKGPQIWRAVYQAIAQDCLTIGLPDPAEVRRLLDPQFVIEKGRVRAADR